MKVVRSMYLRRQSGVVLAFCNRGKEKKLIRKIKQRDLS